FGAAMDPKTSLQELASTLSLGNPSYRVTEAGPDHDKTFHATVVLRGAVYRTRTSGPVPREVVARTENE
ncbi:hypothetical protein IAE22_32655, partial [Bacillus sp. S34]|nr:hypothetical protein [Bacillus sp. S34]